MACILSVSYDVALLGTRQLILQRADCAAPVVALTNPSERPVRGADFEIEPDPETVVELVKKLTSDRARAAD